VTDTPLCLRWVFAPRRNDGGADDDDDEANEVKAQAQFASEMIDFVVTRDPDGVYLRHCFSQLCPDPSHEAKLVTGCHRIRFTPVKSGPLAFGAYVC